MKHGEGMTWTAVREAVQHCGRWALARPWPCWAGDGGLLVAGSLLLYGIAVDLLRAIPAGVFFVALVILVVRIRYFSGDPLSSDSQGERLFEMLFRLAASYIPAYLMFALVIDLPRNQDLKNLRPFLANQTAMLAGDGEAVLKELKKASGYEAHDPPTKEDFVEICQRIDPGGPSAIMVQRAWPIIPATWIEFLFDRRFRSARAIEMLVRNLIYLDPKHKKLIARIENTSYFAQLDDFRASQLAGIPFRNTNLSFLADPLFRYYQVTRELQQYADRHFTGLAWSEPRD